MLISPTLAAGGAVAASQIAAELILPLCQLLRCGFQHVFVCPPPQMHLVLMPLQHVACYRPQTCVCIKYLLQPLRFSVVRLFSRNMHLCLCEDSRYQLYRLY